MLKQKRGITLIALIITIIVLLILAGVVINMTLGNDGIISKAQSSADMYQNAQEKETSMLSQVEAEMDKYMKEGSEGSGGGTGTPITSQITEANVASHIGEYVNLGTNLINKTGTTYKADWRIFDADSTGVYVILADYLPTASIPTTMKVSEETGAKEVTISKNENGWTIGWLASGDGACANNTEAVGTLLTTSNWNFLVSSTSPLRGHITGTPTYEQFARSWNKVNSTQTLSTTPLADDTMRTDGNEYLHISANTDILICLLASYDTSSSNNIWLVNCFGRILSRDFADNTSRGLRPLAYLTSDINVSGQDANGVWQLAE